MNGKELAEKPISVCDRSFLIALLRPKIQYVHWPDNRTKANSWTLFKQKNKFSRSKMFINFSTSKGKSFNFLRRNIYSKVSKLISNNNCLGVHCQANAVQYFHDTSSRLFSTEHSFGAQAMAGICVCVCAMYTHWLTQINNGNQTNKSFILRKWVWKRDKCPTFSTENWKW